MAADEGALRRKVEETQATVEDLRFQYQAEPTEEAGRRLLDARQAASEALQALWDAAPDEKPPAQRLGM